MYYHMKSSCLIHAVYSLSIAYKISLLLSPLTQFCFHDLVFQFTFYIVCERAQDSLFSGNFDIFLIVVSRVAQSVWRLGTGWTIRGSNPGGDEIFRTCPDRPWGPPSLLYNGYQVFPEGSKRPGRDADPSHPSSAEV
jgi:hypothetical protein